MHRKSANIAFAAILAASLVAPGPAWAGPARAAAQDFAGPGQSALTAGTVFSVVPGYGLGHFVIGNYDEGLRFLAMDLGATALWMVGPSIVAIVEGAGMNTTPSAASNAVFALGLLAQGGLKVWETSSARAFVLEQPKNADQP